LGLSPLLSVQLESVLRARSRTNSIEQTTHRCGDSGSGDSGSVQGRNRAVDGGIIAKLSIGHASGGMRISGGSVPYARA
jgi:hypothetical protein